MRFLQDENVSYQVASHLKAIGHDAVLSADAIATITRGRARVRPHTPGSPPLAGLSWIS